MSYSINKNASKRNGINKPINYPVQRGINFLSLVILLAGSTIALLVLMGIGYLIIIAK